MVRLEIHLVYLSVQDWQSQKFAKSPWSNYYSVHVIRSWIELPYMFPRVRTKSPPKGSDNDTNHHHTRAEQCNSHRQDKIIIDIRHVYTASY